MHWSYLKNSALKTRYAITAWLLRKSKRIIEIGGYKTPITEFVHGKNTYVEVIDPKISSKKPKSGSQKTRLIYHKCDFSDWNNKTAKPFDLVFLGLDLHSTEKTEFENITTFCKFIHFCAAAKSVVIEFPIEFARAKRQVETILAILQPKILFDCTIDFSSTPLETFDLQKEQRSRRLIRRLIMFNKPEPLDENKLPSLVSRNLYGSVVSFSIAKKMQMKKNNIISGVKWETIRFHNNSSIENLSENKFAFHTPSSAWAYAWDVEIDLPPKIPIDELVLEVQAKVESGCISVSVADKDEKELFSEVFIKSKSKKIVSRYLSLPEGMNGYRLLLRTGDHSSSAKISFFTASLLHCK